MLKNTSRVRNVARNTIESVLHEISEAFETFIPHYDISRYETFYNRCCRLLRYDIIQ